MVEHRSNTKSRKLVHYVDKAQMETLSNAWRERGLQVYEQSGNNPLCGDSVRIAIGVSAEGCVVDACWSGYACSLCTASADVVTDIVVGRTPCSDAVDLTQVLEALGNPQVGRNRRECIELPLVTFVEVCQHAEICS